jgi:hypothetical protein
MFLPRVKLQGNALFKNSHIMKTGFLGFDRFSGGYGQYIFKKFVA